MLDTVILNEVFLDLFNVLYFSVILTTIFVVILDNRNPVKTMAWILVLFFLPLVGLIFYFFFGRSTRKEHLISKKGYSRLNKRPMAEYQAQVAFRDLESKNLLMSFFLRINKALPFDGNQVDVYTNGYSMLQALMHEISLAKHHIHLQFYIFEDDSLGRLLRDLLIDKARAGVKVRLLYDDVGCWKVNPLFYDQMLCEGIEVQSFLKVRFPRFASKMNYRNHRKIAIIDGKVGFIGGMNIAERYLRGLSWGIWRDTHVRIKGKAVYGLQTSFLTDWYFVDRMLFTSAEYFPKMEWQGNVLAQIVTSDPVGGWHDMMQGLVKALCCAKRYFYIETPYLLPTEEVIMGLQTAALAGVDVRIMLPKRADTFIIHKGSLSYLDELMRAGVKVYLYRKGFLHSKLWVSDDEWASVGSTNMDFRSFEHNFEANAFFYDKDMALHLKEIFLTDQKKCLLLSRKLWSKRSWSNKILESIVRLLAPLL
ncbi:MULTISPECIES: cardiolipin synthase [Bacteroidaceae]|uniref:cardiolipin synthase n=1 Tax=Bacteroidaceae TaxID=815 RepID=UPI000B3702BB|nr:MULTISPECIES: cardiolipin synthase [Bacteroidaceae]MDM8306715.1 cardiolipin synthase [Phocaeicola salanitronis]OUO16490.1 cardiolipin synthase [Bacteroides sp. An322]